MAEKDNIAKLEQMGGECIAKKDLSVFGEIWADDCVDHDPAPGQGQGSAGLKQFWTDFLAAFPDLSIEVDDMVATDDRLALAYRVSGTHKGAFMGIDPTGRSMEIRGLQLSRHDQDGKIVERWGSSDVLGIMQQIGAVSL